MNRNRWLIAGLGAVALAVVLLIVFWPSVHPNRPSDIDHARDCWAQADQFGHRHCART